MDHYSVIRRVADTVAVIRVIIFSCCSIAIWANSHWHQQEILIVVAGCALLVYGCITAWILHTLISEYGVLVDNSQVIAQHVNQISTHENNKESMSAESGEDKTVYVDNGTTPDVIFDSTGRPKDN